MLKQVIVMRTDLPMRKGKQMVQAAHASMEFLRSRIGDEWEHSKLSPVQLQWLRSPEHMKICCRVENEEQLLALHGEATNNGLESHIVTDLGFTEFNGVPTKTCLAIGPDDSEKIDAITRKLSLL